MPFNGVANSQVLNFNAIFTSYAFFSVKEVLELPPNFHDGGSPK